MKYDTRLAALILVFAPLSVQSQSDTPAMAKSQSGVAIHEGVDWNMCAVDGISVGGFDLVSYRQPDGPVPGSRDFAVAYRDSIYLFANESNQSLFLENAERYVPVYSGFCAITLALGRVTCPDYTNFKIENDQLLLFEVTGFTNGRTLWNSDPDSFRQQADDNFLQLLEQR